VLRRIGSRLSALAELALFAGTARNATVVFVAVSRA
jgi:hypothetical protein